ncbi:probable assembly chaperone of rpl4 [Exaiptasia diaphana]|uniref:Uncharacterized protein n=1 Tax=Exaiptasia diaphana TaxID=2652724 RepID=A0A913WXU9_EXADI|nr:probable assembly chaperone of rpl4 [Exaiptasia diaphana]KXJ16984.1 UPF0661 TPR repeat-containing protein C16D10.01c [Exaiptasia diaphana]
MGKERKKKKKKPSKSNKGKQNGEQNQLEGEEYTIEEQVTVDENTNGHNEAPKDVNQETIKNYSVEDFLQKIEDFMDTFNYELAQKFCERALEIDSNHLELLETAGAVFLETGETEKAKKCLEHAVELSPENGHTKYMYLGQILQGQEAVQAFTKGIDIMVKTLDSNQEGATSADSVNPTEISTAYCSLAEIYMTDECFDSEAESKCFQFCQKAIEYDSSNPDAYQVMANCLLSQEKVEEARSVLKKGLDLWLGKDEEVQQVPMPAYESRFTTAKLVLELGDFELAESVLQTLLDENDEDYQVWYLLGWMYHLSGQDNTSKKICLEKAQKIINKCEVTDEDIMKHIEELLSEASCDDQIMDDDDDAEDDDEDDMET